MYPCDNSWMRKIGDLKPHLIRSEGEPSPYLDQAVVVSHSHHQSRIGRELREFHRARKLAFPYKTRNVVHEPKGEAGVAHQQLVRGAPRQGIDWLIVIVGA